MVKIEKVSKNVIKFCKTVKKNLKQKWKNVEKQLNLKKYRKRLLNFEKLSRKIVINYKMERNC